MNEPNLFKQSEIDRIQNRFGKSFYQKVLRDVAVYSNRWNLIKLKFIPSYSANIVFKCYSDTFGNVVLKIGNPSSKEIRTEFNTLKEYRGQRFIHVFEEDIENGVILEEYVKPGTPLRNEESLEKRLSIFCSLYEGLHVEPENAAIYPTYMNWVSRINEYMSRRQDFQELYLYMKKAEDICLSLTTKFSKMLLLHGDFHHDNILLGPDGVYKIIDPKGVIGDPIFDIPRFILNEFEDEITPDLYMKINNVITFLEKRLHIPNDIIRKCLFVETAMGICWCVEDGATLESAPNLIQTVAFADTILKS
ncbi:MAG TPA: aminoglycoside phosphotransferase family protein [Bacillaceae bacterium]|nr:aminoglycoside phosphotransferase family protein [Bacillaceae bacterium]